MDASIVMDIKTYERREKDLAVAERLLSAEKVRVVGTRGYTIDAFKRNMLQAIKRGKNKIVEHKTL